MTVIYTVYADVSGGHDGSPVMVMGGYVARLGQWANLNRQFGLLLKKNKLTHHHTKKMYHGSGEYAGWKLTQKIRYMDKVERIIEKNTLCGFTVSMSHEDYAEHYAKDRPPAIVLDSKYGLCFRLFLTMLGNLFQRSLTGVELHLVLEDGDQGIGNY